MRTASFAARMANRTPGAMNFSFFGARRSRMRSNAGTSAIEHGLFRLHIEPLRGLGGRDRLLPLLPRIVDRRTGGHREPHAGYDH